MLLLVADVLADALAGADVRALELDDTKRDAVDVEHDVRALVVLALDRDLLGDDEVVRVRVAPVDEPDGLEVLADVALDLHAVAQQVVDLAVGVVERLAGSQRDSCQELLDGATDELLVDTAGEQVLTKQRLVDVGVVLVLQVAAVLVAEPSRNSLTTRFWVSRSFWPTVLMTAASTGRRVRPVSSSCIMPVLMARADSRRRSKAAISASASAEHRGDRVLAPPRSRHADAPKARW